MTLGLERTKKILKEAGVETFVELDPFADRVTVERLGDSIHIAITCKNIIF